ncbi:MAG: trypsin-like peptidase domain-containing protein [Chloroflexota bacterium]|nr:trypsin-like peptidase domain-containing protein [Chloroflexota bacterium]
MSILQRLNDEMANVATVVQPGIVRVLTGQNGAGAGTVWHSDGLIITNAHVVGHGGALRVALPGGRVLPAQVIAHSRERDLAALAIEANGLPTIQPGNSSALQPGDWVMALGHPWGVMNAATSGIVINVGRDLPDMGSTAHNWVIASLHMRPGHSGGPLVNVNGQLVGVNTMITGPDVGIAVAVDEVKDFLKRTIGSTTPANMV